jgi:SRSO17 transposase
VLAAVREQVLPALARHGPVAAWIIDDTAFPKKGRHSVGVARQYCGQLGKQENCQVAVSLSVATEHASLPVAFELYLPEDWAGDPARRAKAGVPPDLPFRTKPRIALGQIRRALADGVPPGVVLGDAGYGIDTDFRTALTASALPYVLGVQSTVGVWPPGCGPLAPKPRSGRGRPPKLRRRDAEHQPVTARELALALPPSAWRTVGWREGSRGELSGRFAAVRVRPSHRDYWRAEPHPEEWLLVEWPEGKDQVLALDPARDGPDRGAGRDRQDALADRAGLPGAQAGAGSRPLRGAGLARLPPPRHPVHRGLRLPRSRAEPFPPRARFRGRTPAPPPGRRPRGRPEPARAP